MPSNTDISVEANIVRVKLFRNEFFGHIPDTGVSTAKFEARWKEVSTTLVNLGMSQSDIDRLKDEECGEEEVDRIRREWSENDTKVALRLLGVEKILLGIHSDVKSIKSEKTSSNKYLDSCNFDTEIKLLNKKWCKDTREWVFDQVSDWFNDATSDSRAFIITGPAGMGKSVIAAVICKRFTEQLAACHFCQYNNDRYNNPKILLQSLAKQLSNVIPEYRKALTEKLSVKERQRLENMEILGLFSLLFKEPLAGIQVAERYLIVIDAIDESQHEGKSDVVDLIADYLGQLPCFIRFLITSRPEKNITKKLEKLKPMFLSPSDKQNVSDIQCFFETKLSCSQEAKQISRLVEKSEGLMLFANCLLDILENDSLKLKIDDLPSGIETIYESYFKRWENEFQIVGVGDKDFLTFLSVMAVAKQPLPEALVERVFDFDNNSSAIARRKMEKIKNCLSLLIVIQQGRLTFFHKSVKDWLVESKHDFTVDEKIANETLAIICAMEMDEIKKNGMKPPFHVPAEYALLYGIQHKLAGNQSAPLETFINRYVTDLEIMYACVTVDVYALLNNIICVKNNAIYNSLPEETRKNVKTLMLLIRKYVSSLKDFPQSFLQRVLNWGGDELSLKAASLLKSRYKEHVYFEPAEKDGFEDSLVGRIVMSGLVVGIDISPLEDHVICRYRNGKIELFSTVDFKSLWTIQHQQPSDTCSWSSCRSIVFHPKKNVILPGMLDPVINLHGNFEPGPFLCKDISRPFDNCCFSNDKSKMATTHRNDLAVWNLVRYERLGSFSCNKAIISVSFSANGRFLATSDEGRTVAVYDLEKDFIMISKLFDQNITFASTFEADSWYCHSDLFRFFRMFAIRSDLLISKLDFTYRRYPKCIPLNVKAVAAFEAAVKNIENSWLNKFDSIGFFCLDNGIALVFDSYRSYSLEFFRISKLKEAQSMTDDPVAYAESIDISADGKFIYATDDDGLWTHEIDCNFSILPPSARKRHKIPFVPVTNGVFFCGDLYVSREWFLTNAQCIFPRYLDGIPELWNSDLSERLDRFPKLFGSRDCRSVSRETVAFIMAGKVCFFDVVKREVISETHIPQNMEVIACSSKHHVLMNGERARSPPSMWQTGQVLAEWEDIFNEPKVLRCSFFSPCAKTLVLCFNSENHFFIFNVCPAKLRHKVDFEFLYNYANPLGFLDEDHLLSRAYEESLCIINVTSGNALSCIDIGALTLSWCLSRSPDINCSVISLCVRAFQRKTKIIKVWLPR